MQMRMKILKQANADAVMDLFCRCFFDDHYYAGLFPDEDTRAEQMWDRFFPCVSYCLEHGYAIGIADGEKLVAFGMYFDYFSVKNTDPSAFYLIFAGSSTERELPYESELHGRIEKLGENVMYCLSVAADPAYRSLGLASGMMDHVLQKYPQHFLVSDVSNEGSLPIYQRRNFLITPVDEGYFLVVHDPHKVADTVVFGENVLVAVPDPAILEESGIPFKVRKKRIVLIDYAVRESFGVSCFVSQDYGVAEGTLVELSYEAFLHYQRLINVSHYEEKTRGDFLVYVQKIPYFCRPLLNGTLREMLPVREKEWAVIPDVYVSVPVQYSSLERIPEQENMGQAKDESKEGWLLKNLDFCTYYEAGIPSDAENVDELSWFKQRIQRVYLGKAAIQIESEVTVEDYSRIGEPIGAPALVDLYISIDRDSDCAVLTWYSLSAPFLISHLMDNVIRNQVTVIEDGIQKNFYDYLNEHYGIVKRGTAKIFSVIPKDKSCLEENQLASLLAGETIYPEGENFGRIIDADIVSAVRSKVGMGQYDRAFLCAYTNVVLQFSPGFMASLQDRLSEEAITLFYIELILLEEAAIQIADRSIITLLSSETMEKPLEFLECADQIYNNYSRTIEFWDIQMNYPTSQKSVAMLRKAFQIDRQLAYMKRNEAHLQTVFQTKSNLVDRGDSKRMNLSLAILSVLAVFSAWIDGHDYIATWSDVFSPFAIRVMQKVLFVLILVTAGYAVSQLFGKQLRTRMRDRREKRRKK